MSRTLINLERTVNLAQASSHDGQLMFDMGATKNDILCVNIYHQTSRKIAVCSVSSTILKEKSSFFERKIAAKSSHELWLELEQDGVQEMVLLLWALHCPSLETFQGQLHAFNIWRLDSLARKYETIPAIIPLLALAYQEFHPFWWYSPRALELALITAYNNRSSLEFRNITAKCVIYLQPVSDMRDWADSQYLPDSLLDDISRAFRTTKKIILDLLDKAYGILKKDNSSYKIYPVSESLHLYNTESRRIYKTQSQCGCCCMEFRTKYFQTYLPMKDAPWYNKAVEDIVKAFKNHYADIRGLHSCGAGSDCPLLKTVRWFKKEATSIMNAYPGLCLSCCKAFGECTHSIEDQKRIIDVV